MPLTSEDRAEVAALVKDAFEPMMRALVGNRVVPASVEPEPLSQVEKHRIETIIGPAMFGKIDPYPADSDEIKARSVETLRRRKGYYVWEPSHELRYHNEKNQLVCVNIEKVREFARNMPSKTPPTEPASRSQGHAR